jgi:hypothetical protein
MDLTVEWNEDVHWTLLSLRDCPLAVSCEQGN